MKNSQDTRRNIINASLDLFASKGYAGTSMNDIISKVGISKGSVYWHFKSKEEIFIQVVTESYDEWISLIHQEFSKLSDPIDMLRRYGELFIATIDMPVWRISPEIYWNEFSEENQIILDKCFSQDDDILLNIFENAKGKGLLRYDDCKQLMWTYISCLEGMFEKIILSYKYNDHATTHLLESYTSDAISMFLNAVTK